MNAESKINVHYSSLVGLKAELLRKQAEIEATKVKQENVQSNNSQKPKVKKSNEKQKKKILENDQNKNEPEDIESIKSLKKSQLMLQAKSRLYEKLSKSHTNMNPNFLVDFEHKSNESEEELKCNDNEWKSEDEQQSDDDSDSEWVEYTDCFGRTRKCLKEDLPKMQEKDMDLRKKIVEEPKEKKKRKSLFYEDRIPEKEPEIEIMRRKWEEQTAKLANKVNIHYQDVLFDEARTHGVGYYSFSLDEEERAKQQESLMNLRKETEQKQKENQELKDMKDKIQQNRLRAARLRQRIRAGLPAEETEEEKIVNDTIPKIEDSSKQETIVNEENKESDEQSKQSKLQDIENKIDAFGELLGKSNRWYVMSQEEWVDKKRKERNQEFGPTYNNFHRGKSFQLNDSTYKKNASNTSSDSDDSDIIGPVPLPQNVSELSTNNKTSSETAEGTSGVNTQIADRIEAGLKYLRNELENKRS